MNYYYLVISV